MSKHKTIPKNIRLKVYEKYNHKCAYCGCDLEYKDMQVDHIKPIYTNMDVHTNMTEEEMYSIDNLMPACRQCNFYKSTFNFEKLRDRLKSVLLKNLTNSFQFKLAEKYGLVSKYEKDIEFYFEKERDNEKHN